ncbi:MAG: transcription termination/antitermination protein NusA [Clostridia bacterium]|nr:transcription termination/antitermination protein NusA [Clostridia bacterium]MBR5015587.1 transcription termination/antitermination protein NusA [Clostridia bacterium]MBR5976615.1 transcription termination/antitermination protein NusA [Clostridia bacterium]MBR5991156.1 transcription termination/antitermination protein NusA [Clostridia bacterium]MBR6479336.1 transcription termination/antitermination protein NusA [Clostridia bacterium]
MNEEFFEAVEMMAKEKGIPVDFLYEKIANALVVSVRRMYNGKDIVFCDINPEKQELNVYLRKNVVEEISDEDADILVDAARKYKKRAKPGDIIEIPLDTKDFGRIAAQTAKHVIRQGIRDAERGQAMQEFQSHNQEIVTAKVMTVDPKTGNATLEIGKAEALLPHSEQIPGEELYDGDLIKVFIVDVRDTEKGPKAMISRTHPGLVRKLFETEVPEIADGTVEIKEVSREAGSRTKIAVYSADENVDAVGACIGPRGARVAKVVDLLCGEKIDIVPYSDDPALFVGAALAPADVIRVDILSEEEKSCKVIVPDTQLSLAIGNKGQNARLAAKLTGWKIDINPESGFYESSSEEE